MPERIQLRRIKGWRKPEGVINVGRPTRWGNPWGVRWRYRQGVIIDDYGSAQLVTDLLKAHEIVVGRFRDWLATGSAPVSLPYALADLRHRRQLILDNIGDLRGHDLACWCPPEFACHATVLLDLANG